MTQPDWRAYEWTESDWLVGASCISVVVPADVDSLVFEMADVVDTERCDFDRLENLSAGATSVRGERGAAVGLVHVEGAVLMLEPYGGLGEIEDFMIPLSRGRNIMSYYVGGHGRGTFKWYDDGQVKCAFDHHTPGARRGTDPDVVLPWMDGIGGFMPLDSEAEVPATVHTEAAVMALMERVSGVQVTHSLLHESTYLTALVRPIPVS
jgi:hypothetical protein